VQISWLPDWFNGRQDDLALALRANPTVAWYLGAKCPTVRPWLDALQQRAAALPPASSQDVRQAELNILDSMQDLLVYALDPAVYDAQPFLSWDDRELTSLVNFSGKTVLDIGAGTGRLALVAARTARLVYAVEPVENLRRYLREKARAQGFTNLYAVDGILTDLPFPAGFADVVLGGHVYGDQPEAEITEVLRVTRRGGMVIFCPGNRDVNNPAHACLVSLGFHWSRFEEPRDGSMRKYWKTVP
jgi:SAM-dependent methyltransferase